MPRDLEEGPIGGGAKLRCRPSDLDATLDRLGALADEAMPDAWMDRFGTAPRSALPPRLLRLAIAYDLQATALGGLGKAIEKRLLRTAEWASPIRTAQPAPVRLKPGVALLRDWGGRTYRVEVLADGNFNLEGRVWRSLSSIARKVSRTHGDRAQVDRHAANPLGGSTTVSRLRHRLTCFFDSLWTMVGRRITGSAQLDLG